MTTAEDVLGFWFGRPDEAHYGEFRDVWFRGRNPAFDGDVHDRFLALHEDAAAGRLDGWRTAPRSCLALVIALDQFPRNMFRDTPRMYATDPAALAVARHALDRAFDRGLPDVMRLFYYLPFQHSEDLADQETALRLFLPLGRESGREAALRHHEIVERFGRFPHRNAILGRESTPEEVAFLLEPNSSF